MKDGSTDVNMIEDSKALIPHHLSHGTMKAAELTLALGKHVETLNLK